MIDSNTAGNGNDERRDRWAGQSPWAEAGVDRQDYPPGLYVVATPLGNAADVTLRALWVLRLADCIAAEDTRTTAPLLARFGVAHARRDVVALHRHNEAQASEALVARIAQGQRVALVTDAGTPAISDPGAVLVRAVLDAGLRVIPVPGPSSLAAALSAAGVHSSSFRFAGFPPTRGKERTRFFAEIGRGSEASVIFEAPHRVADTARELASALEPARRVIVARELTKKFESIVQTTAQNLDAAIAQGEERGEFVLVVDAPAQVKPGGEDLEIQVDEHTERWLRALAEELPASRAAAVAAKASGLPREVLYRLLVGPRDVV